MLQHDPRPFQLVPITEREDPPSDQDHQALTEVVRLSLVPGVRTRKALLERFGNPAAVLPVAILSTPDFDATTVDTSDLSQIKFGDPKLSGRVSALRASVEDVDGDGYPDVMLHFSIEQIKAHGALNDESVSAEVTAPCLIGSTPLTIRGTDSVRIVPRRTSGLSPKRSGRGLELAGLGVVGCLFMAFAVRGKRRSRRRS